MAAYPSIPIATITPIEANYMVLKDTMEMGYVVRRPAVTKNTRGWRITHQYMTMAEKETLRAFWDARKGGGEAFTFTDPTTSTTHNVVFNMDRLETPKAPLFNRFHAEVVLEEAL